MTDSNRERERGGGGSEFNTPGSSSPSPSISVPVQSLEVGMRERWRCEQSFCCVVPVSKLPEICGYKENTVESAKPGEEPWSPNWDF